MINQRKCGDCQLCCTLMPIAEIGKKANQRCKHQGFGKGCKIYPQRPRSCEMWSCAWLANNASVGRPDHTHYVIDTFPTTIGVQNGVTGEIIYISATQVWCDPKYPDAHRDPALRDYLLTLPTLGVALVRYNSSDGVALVPPQGPGSSWRELAGCSVG